MVTRVFFLFLFISTHSFFWHVTEFLLLTLALQTTEHMQESLTGSWGHRSWNAADNEHLNPPSEALNGMNQNKLDLSNDVPTQRLLLIQLWSCNEQMFRPLERGFRFSALSVSGTTAGDRRPL